MITKTLTQCVDNYWSINEKLAVLKIKTSPHILNEDKPTLIINLHLPTAITTAVNSDERENIDSEIEKLLSSYATQNKRHANINLSCLTRLVDGTLE